MRNRRNFLKAGALTTLGLTLPRVLRATETAKAKSCIMLFLNGGPATQDMWDLHPQAPAEYAGEFKPIATNVAGMQISEHLPRIAQQADRFALVRSVTHTQDDHEQASHYLQTARTKQPTMQFPSFGAIATRQHPAARGLPGYIGLQEALPFGGGGFLGAGFNPFQAGGDPNDDGFGVSYLEPIEPVPAPRIDRRRQFLTAVDDRFTKAQPDRLLADADVHLQRAYDIVTSPKAREAFKIQDEPGELRERYGRNGIGQSLLLARRLVEAGVRFVTVGMGGWDTHGDNFTALKKDLLPPVDNGVAGLLHDLDDRGLLDETLVVVMGEFGRTPKVNEGAGRDHWPHVMSVLLAGGGIRGGQVYGKSDEKGEFPAENPVKVEQLTATIYHALGIDPSLELHAPNGRPIRIANHGMPVEVLF